MNKNYPEYLHSFPDSFICEQYMEKEKVLSFDI